MHSRMAKCCKSSWVEPVNHFLFCCCCSFCSMGNDLILCFMMFQSANNEWRRVETVATKVSSFSFPRLTGNAIWKRENIVKTFQLSVEASSDTTLDMAVAECRIRIPQNFSGVWVDKEMAVIKTRAHSQSSTFILAKYFVRFNSTAIRLQVGKEWRTKKEWELNYSNTHSTHTMTQNRIVKWDHLRSCISSGERKDIFPLRNFAFGKFIVECLFTRVAVR